MTPKRRLDPEDDAGGLPAPKRRMTELLAALLDRGKINDTTVNQTNLMDHQKPQASGTLNSSPHKRPISDIEEESSPPERTAKRPALDRTQPKIVDEESRLKIYQVLQECTRWDAFCSILNTAHELGDMTLAQVLHDSPPAMRLKALRQLGSESRGKYLELITDIEHEKKNDDPRSRFPTVVTDSFLDFLFISNTDMRGKAVVCIICDRGFCKNNVEEEVYVEDVIWKDCEKHLMHTECFRSKVLEGSMPHLGLCPCVPAFDLA